MSDKQPDETQQPLLISMEAFAELVRIANDGDAQALAELRNILDNCPQIWQQVGDLCKHAEIAMIKLISNGNRLIAESLARKAADMRRELSGPSPSPLEQMCVQRIVATWLELQWTDTTFPEPAGETLEVQRFVLKRKESAERRFAASVKSLTVVRKLLPQGAGPKAKVKMWPEPEEIVAGVIGEVEGGQGKSKKANSSRRKPEFESGAEEFARDVSNKWAPISGATG